MARHPDFYDQFLRLLKSFLIQIIQGNSETVFCQAFGNSLADAAGGHEPVMNAVF